MDPDVEDLVDVHKGHQYFMDLVKIDPQAMRRYKKSRELFDRTLRLVETINRSIQDVNCMEGKFALITMIRQSDANSIEDDFKIAKKVFGDHGLSEKDALILESLEKLSKSLMWKPELMETLEPLDVPQLDKKMVSGSKSFDESIEDFVSRQGKNIRLLEDLERRASSATDKLVAHCDSIQKAFNSYEQAQDQEFALKKEVLLATKATLETDPGLSPQKSAVLRAMPEIVEGRGNLKRQFRDLACG